MSSVITTFTVPGKPVRLKRHRHTRSGHVYDPSAADKKTWIANVQSLTPSVVPETPLLDALYIKLDFAFKRPKCHYRTGKYSNELKPAFIQTHHTCTPDIDNLAKFCLDAMNRVFYKDDAQVVRLECTKRYTNNDSGSTTVTISLI